MHLSKPTHPAAVSSRLSRYEPLPSLLRTRHTLRRRAATAPDNPLSLWYFATVFFRLLQIDPTGRAIAYGNEVTINTLYVARWNFAASRRCRFGSSSLGIMGSCCARYSTHNELWGLASPLRGLKLDAWILERTSPFARLVIVRRHGDGIQLFGHGHILAI